MTAAELIARLQALPPEAQQLDVETEGCDCNGDVSDVEVHPDHEGKRYHRDELGRLASTVFTGRVYLRRAYNVGYTGG